MEKLNREQIMTLPNGVTIIRVLAIPVILTMIFYSGRDYRLLTGLLFLLVASTDMIDGYLARRYDLTTTLGKFLDPLADKLLIVTSMIALVPGRDVPVGMVIVIVGREIAVTGLRGIAVSQGMVIAASTLGKYKTVFEVVAVSCLIVGTEFMGINLHQVGMGLFWIALVLAVVSGIDYFKRFLKTVIV